LKKLIYLIILSPLLLKASDSTTTQNMVRWESRLNIESNSLDMSFIDNVLYGGYIDNKMKYNWISNLEDNNTLFAEISNQISYKRKYKDNILSISIKDRNLGRVSFRDDLFGIALLGNYHYQDDTLIFNNTSFRLERFQQICFGYAKSLMIQKKKIKISTNISYINGIHHLNLYSKRTSFYTSKNGTTNYLNYDLKAFSTTNEEINYFENNGNGVSFDMSLKIENKNKKYTIYISDLGFIQWNESSFKYNTDTLFSFSGIEVENILDFNDSIIELESEKYIEAVSINAKKGKIKSYMPANFGVNIESQIKNSFLNKYIIGFNIKWQPHEDNRNISFDKILQGFYESGYSPYFYFSAYTNTRYALLIPKISIGGYTQKLNFGIISQFGAQNPISIGTHHLESLFKGKESNSLSVYLQIDIKF